MKTLACAIVLACVSPLSAQIYSPANFETAEANTWSANGIATTSSPSVHLQVHDGLMGQTAMLKDVSFRRDSGAARTTTTKPFVMLVNVNLSTAATTAATVDATFANNHGANKVKVTNFAQVNVAALPPNLSPGPWGAIVIPFQTPYAWAGAGPLCCEIQVQSRAPGVSVWCDYTSGASTNPTPITLPFGTGCTATGESRTMNLSGSGSASWSGGSVTLRYNGSYFPQSALVSLLVGGSNTSISGVPLPWALPGTTGGASGVCTLYNDIVLVVPALTDTTGRMSANLGMFVHPGFNGLSLYSQVAALDAAANNFGVVLSNSVQHHLVAPHPAVVGIVYSNTTLGPMGTARANAGHVVRFGT